MERSRSTHKQSRRHTALRRTLRRQGVFFEQEGGARAVGWNLFPTEVKEAKEFLINALKGSDFEFITSQDNTDSDWRKGADAAKKYAMLIMRQDELLSLGLENVRNALEITDTTTDGELIKKINVLKPDDLNKYIKVLEILGKAVIQSPINVGVGMDTGGNPIEKTDSKQQLNFSKLQYNLSASTDVTLQMRLIFMLLYPSLMINITVRGIAEVLKRLKEEKETTLPLIITKDPTIHSILSDKYTWYLRSTAATLTNDQLRDSICLWAKASTGEKAWTNFFKRFLQHLTEQPAVTDNKGVLAKLENLTSGKADLVDLTRKVSTEEYNSRKESGDDTTDMKICSFIAAVVFGLYNGGATTKKAFLAPFLSEVELPEALPAGMPGREKNNYALAASKEQLTGMLPTAAWSQALLEEEGAGDVTFGGLDVTFGGLLNTLSPRYIHFLLHLVSTLLERKEQTAVAGGADAPPSA